MERYIAYLREMRNTYKILVENTVAKRPRGRPRARGRIIL
jgi:hypothetical protein